jgi:hypothetical protein
VKLASLGATTIELSNVPHLKHPRQLRATCNHLELFGDGKVRKHPLGFLLFH